MMILIFSLGIVGGLVLAILVIVSVLFSRTQGNDHKLSDKEIIDRIKEVWGEK